MLRKKLTALILAVGLAFGGAVFYDGGMTVLADDDDDDSSSDSGTVTVVITYDPGSSSSGSSSSSSGGMQGASTTTGSDAYSTGHGSSAAVYVMTKPGTVRYEETRVGKKAKQVTIPNTVRAGGGVCKVTAIASYAISGSYSGYDRLKSVEVGKNVKRIHAKAFEGVPNLKTIRIRTEKLTKRACYDCLAESAVKTVIVPQKKLEAYRKIFTESNCGKKVTVKAN